MSRHWQLARKNYIGPSSDLAGFITDQRGRGFQFHGGTKHHVLDGLCEYLDTLETLVVKLGGKVPYPK